MVFVCVFLQEPPHPQEHILVGIQLLGEAPPPPSHESWVDEDFGANFWVDTNTGFDYSTYWSTLETGAKNEF